VRNAVTLDDVDLVGFLPWILPRFEVAAALGTRLVGG